MLKKNEGELAKDAVNNWMLQNFIFNSFNFTIVLYDECGRALSLRSFGPCRLTSHSSKEKFLNKGCPQRSVSGPFLWNVIINNFLEKILAFSSCETIAFADDLLLCFQGKSFPYISRQAQLTLDFASTWTKNYKLEFNAVKSKVMFLEKRENKALTGNLILNGFSLDCVRELKYLGLNRVAINSFGIKSNVSSLIYKQGIVPFICYGSRIWGSALKKKINCRLLRKIQRRILLRVISGYRTISYEAVFAISGFPPIDIFIKRNNEFKIATKNCTNKSLDSSLGVSELPYPSENDFPLTWLITVQILKTTYQLSALQMVAKSAIRLVLHLLSSKILLKLKLAKLE
ncbi:reverse transcriptase domain-containing protein [Trichonephila clavipes]|nr:reverse transcriptase domain-containing protein [Trichonephila clavipes]